MMNETNKKLVEYYLDNNPLLKKRHTILFLVFTLLLHIIVCLIFLNKHAELIVLLLISVFASTVCGVIAFRNRKYPSVCYGFLFLVGWINLVLMMWDILFVINASDFIMYLSVAFMPVGLIGAIIAILNAENRIKKGVFKQAKTINPIIGAVSVVGSLVLIYIMRELSKTVGIGIIISFCTPFLSFFTFFWICFSIRQLHFLHKTKHTISE